MVLVWEPITDLPQDWSALTDGELGPLLQFWNDQRADLEQKDALAEFNQRLAREWSIETGQIEGVYNLDRGVTETLIERGINADLIPTQPGQKLPELIAAIIQDHVDVLEGLFQFVKGERPISKSYIHELHAALLRHQETSTKKDQFGNLFESKLHKGKYKECPNIPTKPDGTIHQYCPPEQVDPEMERLLAMHEDHAKKRVAVEVEVAWLHHRFTQIHPYQDGNGRVARALASLIFIKAGWFPVAVTRDARSRYIEALEFADEGDLKPLVSFLVDVQKRSLLQALKAADDVQEVLTVDEAIAAAKRALAGHTKDLEPTTWIKAKDTADRLMNLTVNRLNEIAQSMAHEIGSDRPDSQFSTTAKIHPPSYAVKVWPQVMFGYKPNTTDYGETRALVISLQKQARIEVQAHAIGPKVRGLIAMIAILQAPPSDIQLASKNGFEVNYAEPYESAERRFRTWLEESLIHALDMWRKSL
ncbi:MAG: Fic family protein [Acidobacteriia bacterium]|nr:Fic family protein [Terriglobia bacterium]